MPFESLRKAREQQAALDEMEQQSLVEKFVWAIDDNGGVDGDMIVAICQHEGFTHLLRPMYSQKLNALITDAMVILNERVMKLSA